MHGFMGCMSDFEPYISNLQSEIDADIISIDLHLS